MIELLLVVMALTLITSLVWMTWEAVLPKTQLTTAVRELAALMQETRSDAVSRGSPYTVEYYFEADATHPRGYRVVTPFRKGGGGGLAAGDDERLALAWNPLPDNIEFKRIIIDGVEHTRGRCEVYFDPRGSASDHTVVLEQKPYEHFYTIEVQALTGLIQFHEGEFVREPPHESDFH
jgi:Tfp pilus assembly protein FimT